jgi:cytosine/adenosine deaminase-related metal-dependent hydrolase
MLVITNLTVVTMDDQRRILKDAAIAVDGDKIAAVGPAGALRTRFPDAETMDGRGLVAIPGLIDTHAHADQSLLRGLGDGMHWIPFLDRVVSPYLARRDPADAVLANTLSMIEMVRSGTTCFVSPNVDPRDDLGGLSQAVAAVGIRAVLCRFAMPRPGVDSSAAAKAAVTEASAAMRRWHDGEGGLVKLWFGLDVPRRPGDTFHPNFYREVAAEARRLGVGISYHFCSEIEDAAYIQDTFGMRPAEWSRDNHALGPNVILINGCWVTPEEIRILSDSGTHLAHSPVANMKMATGVLPLPDVLAAGVNVSLGTDGGLNNNTHDMFAEMKAACLLQNCVRRSPTALTALQALELATIHGARAVGRGHELGSIESGKLADIVLVDLNRAHSVPAHDVVSNLVFTANGGNVDTVLIGGRFVLRHGRLDRLDERAVCTQARERAEKIPVELGLPAK